MREARKNNLQHPHTHTHTKGNFYLCHGPLWLKGDVLQEYQRFRRTDRILPLQHQRLGGHIPRGLTDSKRAIYLGLDRTKPPALPALSFTQLHYKTKSPLLTQTKYNSDPMGSLAGKS